MRKQKPIPRRRILSFQHLEQRCLLDASALRITEFMASNDDTLFDFEGDSSDWIEIYNPSSTVASLDGLYLTDKSDELTKWQFPSGKSILPSEYLVVFASDKDTVAPNGELHTNFKLSAGGEYLGLIANDGVTEIDGYSPEFPSQFEDVSYGLATTSMTHSLVAEGDTARAWIPTGAAHDATWTEESFDDSFFNIEGPTGFGYENSPGGTPDFSNEYSTPVPFGTTSLYVRIPFNLETLSGIDRLILGMKYDDGFVAYLNGVEIASVNAPELPAWDSTATTYNNDFDAIAFEDYDVSSAISELVVGDNVLAIHALNVWTGSSDFLVSPRLIWIESNIATPESIGFTEIATPGFGNGDTFAGFVEEPTFNLAHGFYDSPQSVSLASNTPGSLIVYTTDGSTPSVDENLFPINGIAYTSPIAVTSTTTIRAIAFKLGYKESFIVASSYLFLDDVVNQSPLGEAPAGWPENNVNGQLLDYGIDPQIINQYGVEAIKDSLAAIPSIALTTDIENLFDPNTGIYVNALNRGREWERPTSVELIYPDGTPGFSTNAGLRIRGGFGRNDFNPKHAFRLYFRNEYGDGLLNYPLFGEEGVDEFDVLDLRTSSNYSWASQGNLVNGRQNTYLREVFARDTQADLGQPYTRSRYYHLYLDGQYWGLHMTQERVQEHFGESYFGGDQEDYDVVKSDSTEGYITEIADGNDIAWEQLFNLAQELAENPYDKADNYWVMQGLNPDGTRNESLEVLLDVDNLIDYMMIIIYTGGYDTGISSFLGNNRANNWFGIRNREDGEQGFQFFMHDNEHSLGAGGRLPSTFQVDRTGPFYSDNDDNYAYFNPAFLHQDLLEHPEYVQRFVDRVQELMFNNGPLTIDQSIARMVERKQQVEGAIIAHAARWGDAKRAVPYDKSDWDEEVDWLFNTYFQVREDIVIDQLQADGLYNQSGPAFFNRMGGGVPVGYPLLMKAPVGDLYYSLDGQTDPRMIGGALNPSSEVQVFSESVIINESTTVWARYLEQSVRWSGIVKLDFVVPDYDGNGLIEIDDYDIWASTYGSTTDLRADGNKDGIIDAADFTLWQDAFALQSRVQSLQGDYDGNGSVDAGDYDIWVSTYGSTTDLRADGNFDFKVDAADYTVWKNAFDQELTVVMPVTVASQIETEAPTYLGVQSNTSIVQSDPNYYWATSNPVVERFSFNSSNLTKKTIEMSTEVLQAAFELLANKNSDTLPEYNYPEVSEITSLEDLVYRDWLIEQPIADEAEGHIGEIPINVIDRAVDRVFE